MARLEAEARWHQPNEDVAARAMVLAATAVLTVSTVLGSTVAWLDSPVAAAISGTAIAVFGLPHGTLDIEILTASRATDGPWFVRVLMYYLVCTAVMTLLWWTAPLAALGLFLLIAAAHFGEDWTASRSAFLQHGTAIALLSAPALFHRHEIAAIFVALTRRPDATWFADLLLIIAPVAIVVAVAGIAAMIAYGALRTAVSAAISLAVLIALPPVLGFAVYFCLIHSPHHFREALRFLGWSRPRQWLPIVVPVTAAALAIATGLFFLLADTGVPARLVAAVFMTLSVLTLPHLAVPLMLRFDRSSWRPIKIETETDKIT